MTVPGPATACPVSSTCSSPPGSLRASRDARRMIAEGGAYLNNQRVTAEDAVPGAADLLRGRFLVLRRGRRTVAGVEIVTG